MWYRLARILPVLAKYLVLYFIYLLQFLTHLVSCHEQIDCFHLCEVLHFGCLFSRADKDVTRGEGLMIDHGVDIFAEEKDLGGRDDVLPEDDLPCYFHTSK